MSPKGRPHSHRQPLPTPRRAWGLLRAPRGVPRRSRGAAAGPGGPSGSPPAAAREAEVAFPCSPCPGPLRLRDHAPRVTGLPGVGKERVQLRSSSRRSGPRRGLRAVQAPGARAQRACARCDALRSPACTLLPTRQLCPPSHTALRPAGSAMGTLSCHRPGPGMPPPPSPHLNTGDRDTGRESPRPLRGSQRLLSWGAWPSQGAHARGKELGWGPCGPGLRSRCCRCLDLGLPRRHRGLQSLSAPSAKRATKLARE